MKSTKAAIIASTLAVVFACGCAGSQSAGIKPSSAPLASGIKGQVLLKGKAVEGVYVYAYTSPQNDLRLPTKLISDPTGADGGYSLDLVPGTYYIVARKRVSGEATGYLTAGDFEGKCKVNPVMVRPGEFSPVDLAITQMPGKFLLAPYAHQRGDIGLKGKVVKEDGQPVSDAFVMVYTKRDRIGRPTYLSKPTNENGEYVIYLNKPGTYYVAARSVYGDLPRKGEAYGTYDANPDHKVEIADDTIINGIDVTMKKFTRDLTKCAEH
jgi:hypothetical protein